MLFCGETLTTFLYLGVSIMTNDEKYKIEVDIAGIVAIALAIALRLIDFTSQTLNMKTYIVLTSSALLVAAIYVIYGRKQAVDMYYKLFIVLFTIGSGIAIITPFIDVFNGSDSHGSVLISRVYLAFNIIVFLCGVILTIDKKLNKKGALYVANTIFLINAFKVIRAIVSVGTASYITANIGNLLMAYIICSFVRYRYERIEKEISETTI